jgi:HAD superfamily hydrolase (TIGR01509 family)
MRKIQAFLFDLDGTLLDSEVLYVDAVRSALIERDSFLSPEEAQKLVYGRGWREIYEHTALRFPGAYSSIGEMESVVEEHFERLRCNRDIRIHSSIHLLEELARGYPVAIVSGSPRRTIALCVEQMGIGSKLDFYIGVEEYPKGKPDPACYLMAAEKFGLPPGRCLVFEDSAAGVRSAKAAGMLCVGLQRREAPVQDLSSADLVLSDLSQFRLDSFAPKVACLEPGE